MKARWMQREQRSAWLAAVALLILVDQVSKSHFATTLEQVVVESVEAGHMTKDLAVLVGPEQKWETTEDFLATLDNNLNAKLQSK